jgi:hypothetical protein
LRKERIVMKQLINTVKIALIISVVALAIVGSLIVFDVFTTEEARELLIKVLKLIAIWTGASLSILIIALLGTKNT